MLVDLNREYCVRALGDVGGIYSFARGATPPAKYILKLAVYCDFAPDAAAVS